MKRGGYGKPWRPPADGWFAPPKIFFGGLYQHARPALNNLPRYQNNTQVTLQQNEVGPPVTRINPAALVANCGVTDTSGLPEIPWIGVGANQSLPPVLGGTLQNTFALNGTNNLGQAARLRGFKNVQAMRQWHGTPAWTSHDLGGFNSNICIVPVCDGNYNPPPGSGITCPGSSLSPGTPWIPTYANTSFEPYQSAPDAVKYLTLSCSETVAVVADAIHSYSGSLGGSISVEANSGKVTSNLITAFDAYDSSVTPPYHVSHVSGGAGWVNAPPVIERNNGVSTLMDGVYDFHNGGFPGGKLYETDLTGLIGGWNTENPTNQLPQISDINNYSASLTTVIGTQTSTFSLEFHRTATTVTWDFEASTVDSAFPGNNTSSSYKGNYTLSNPNYSADVYSDVKALLGYWNLADDAQYPPRTDGIWQVAPLVSRDEWAADQTPMQVFLPYTVNDLRQPIVDGNGNGPFSTPDAPPALGWHTNTGNNDAGGNAPGSPSFDGTSVPWNPTYNQMAWFDPNAYGFSFPPGYNQGNSAANGWGQFALTGLICGMPMPRAFTDPASFWFVPGFNAPSGSDFENFFDFRANVWKACEFDGGIDIYDYGYGQWLYDAIDTTGAQLPHCATQWTNNWQAANKPPYAYLIQADRQTYDENGQDFTAAQTDALWAQKCCEILELWPSQNFGRPAGNDRFAPDENAVYCIGHWEGSVVFLLSDPAKISTGDYVGVSNNGFVGIFPVTVDHGAESLTLGSQLYPLPTGFALPGGDTGTAVWKVRFPNAPPIQGRDAIASLTASGGNTIITLASPEVNLMTGDTIDICSTTISYDAKGNRVSEQMTVLQTAAVSRTDDTHFTVGVAISTLAGAAYIVSHGAPAWYWDDNGRKGDFAAFQWLYDYRTNGEQYRLSAVTDCGGHKPPTGSPAANTGYQAPSTLPGVCSPANSLNWTGDNFQAQGASTFKPCCYGVVAFTPNGETWNNGVVIPFPATFTLDDRYGARWQAEIEQAMQDLLWQAPHTPCNLGSSDTWNQDDGTCKCPEGCPNGNGGNDFYYAHAPFVEARINLPSNGGNGQNETAPALPSGISIGYINPVTTLTNALTPPGMIGFDVASGNPIGAFTFWGYRLAIEDNACFGTCQFNYVDMENLPCVVSYSPSAPAPIVDPLTDAGSTSDSRVT